MSEAAIPNYEQEIDLCSKAMLIDPKEPQHPINRASCWLQLKEWRKVILDCDLALEMGIEKSEKVYFWKAKAHFFLNQYTDALQNVLEARKMQSKNSEISEALNAIQEKTFYVALHFLSGKGVEKNVDKALGLLTQLSNLDHTEAQFIISWCYRNIPGREDYEKEAEYLALAAAKGHSKAQHLLGQHYMQGKNKDLGKAVNWFTLAAQKGDLDARFSLGMCYYKRKDVKSAVEQLEVAANQGHSLAQYNLACWYAEEDGGVRDLKKAVEYCTLSAKQGNAHAQCNLGIFYQKGEGVEQDLQKAVEWLTLAADQGFDHAQNALAVCLSLSKTEEALKKAAELWTLAANQGHLGALYAVGVCYLKGEGVEKNLKRAIELLTIAANRGHIGALSNLGVCFLKGLGVEKDLGKAIELLTLGVHEGDVVAQCNLALCYNKGEGVERDWKKVAELLTLAANQRNPTAQCDLGMCYLNGEGVEMDLKKAAELFALAANQGLPEAQYNLGVCYRNGRGIKKDVEKAVELFALAANQGHREAQYNLGGCYRGGIGVKKDLTKAIELITSSANQGLAEAQYTLATLYQTGEGVDRNLKKAAHLLTLASNQSDSGAQSDLGVCYLKGEGVELDIEKAITLFTLSADQGLAEAQFNLGLWHYEGAEKNVKKALELFTLAANQKQKQSQDILKQIVEREERILDDFKIIKLIGAGGEGLVFMVQFSGMVFALKMILNFYQKSFDLLENEFEKEWQILESVGENDSIIRAVTRFVAQPTNAMMQYADESIKELLEYQNSQTRAMENVPTWFFVFEYHPVTLEDKLEVLRSEGELDWKRIHQYCLQVVEAISFLFEKCVVHRDLKMENILVSTEDKVILADFGQAFKVNDNHIVSFDTFDNKQGNLMYLAPEIHNNRAKKVPMIDFTQQYSWEAGCLIFQISIGRFPFVSESGSLYPMDFGEPGEYSVPKVEFLENEREQFPEKFLYLLESLLYNAPLDRMQISDALRILREL